MRTRKTMGQAKSLMERYKLSGLSVQSFCTSEQISPVSFYYWRRRLHELSEQASPSLVPVCFEKSAKDHTSQVRGSSIELTYPNGVRLSVSAREDPTLIRTLITIY